MTCMGTAESMDGAAGWAVCLSFVIGGERKTTPPRETSEPAIPFIDLNHRNLADNKFRGLTLSLSSAIRATSNFRDLSRADVMVVGRPDQRGRQRSLAADLQMCWNLECLLWTNLNCRGHQVFQVAVCQHKSEGGMTEGRPIKAESDVAVDSLDGGERERV